MKPARLAGVREVWAERLGVDADHVDGELEARFAALVAAITDSTDGAPSPGSAEEAVLYGDMHTINAFVTEARRTLWREGVTSR